jgi:hypothetical protein
MSEPIVEPTPPVVEEVAAPVKEVAERPEYISEQHWDPEAGQVRVESLAKSFTDTKSALDKRREESGVPMNAQMYLSVKDDGSIHVPDGLEHLPPIMANDLVLESVCKVAHEREIPKGDVDAIIGAYLTSTNTLYGDFAYDEAAVLEGINSDPVKANHTMSGVKSFIGTLGLEEGEDALVSSLTQSVDGVKALTKVMAAAGLRPIHVGAMAAPTSDTTDLRAEWDALRLDPASRDNDASKQKRFEEVGAKLFGA